MNRLNAVGPVDVFVVVNSNGLELKVNVEATGATLDRRVEFWMHLNRFMEMVQVGVRVRSEEPATDDNSWGLYAVDRKIDAFVKEKIFEGLGAEDVDIDFVTEEHAAVGWAFADIEAINVGFDGLVTCLAFFFIKAP